MGIIGWGKIGDGVAHLAQAFGMRVIGTRRSVREPREVAATATAYASPPFLEPVANPPQVVYPESDLRAVLAESDVIVLILPLTAQTEGLLGDDEFAAIKEGAFLLNMGRGAVIQADALVRALESGRLGGAGLDVFAQEPLPASSPLWAMPNVIVSPHLGGRGERTNDRAAHLFAVNLTRYLDGQPLLNVVNREQEY
jgi:phosphoglycerate dehydrogenase-like enzyme